ncbi:uncharacterized protein ACIB01_013543 [Guaruba guarouba]
MHLKSAQIGPTSTSEKAEASAYGDAKICNSLRVDKKAFIPMKKKGSLNDFPWTLVIHANSRSHQQKRSLTRKDMQYLTDHSPKDPGPVSNCTFRFIVLKPKFKLLLPK